MGRLALTNLDHRTVNKHSYHLLILEEFVTLAQYAAVVY